MSMQWVLTEFAHGLVELLDYTTEAAVRMNSEEVEEKTDDTFGLDSPCLSNFTSYPDVGKFLVETVSEALRVWLGEGLIEIGGLHCI